MKTSKNFALVLLLVAACSKSSSEQNKTDPTASAKTTPTPSSTSPKQNNDKGGITLPSNPQLGNPSHKSGSTSFEKNPTITFRVQIGQPEEIAKKIKDQINLIDSSDRNIPIKVQGETSKDNDPTIRISPENDLEIDSWYVLKLNLEGAVPIVISSAEKETTVSDYKLKFFTGSAPHLIEVLLVKKSSTLMILRFSEPVDMKSLVDNIQVVSGGKKITSCVVGAGSCLDKATATGQSEVIQLSVSGDMKEEVSIRIDGQVMGSGRTVSDGSKYLEPSTVENGSLMYNIATWQDVPDGKLWASE